MTEEAHTEQAVKAGLKAHCPRCDGQRNCDVHGIYDQNWSDGSGPYSVDGHIEHRLLQCRGCEIVFYWSKSTNSEDYEHDWDPVTGKEIVYHPATIETFPAPPKKGAPRPDWSWTLHSTDITLSQIMAEVYTASEANALILSSVGLRTALDRCAEMLGIDPAVSMQEKVAKLQEGGWVGETEAQTLNVVAEAGNAAAHRAWTPSSEEFKALLHTLEQFIERAILSGKDALNVAARIPAKPRRQKPPVADSVKKVMDEGP